MARSGTSSPDFSDPTRIQDERATGPSIFKTASLLLVIVAGALFLRFAHLDDWGLWVDEIFTVEHAGELADGDINIRSFAYALSLVGFEASGVDMSTLDSEGVWTWRAAGIDEWNLRAPIALLGGVTVLILGLLAHRTFGSRTTLLLCVLMALSPWHLWMSQVGRFYMQLFLLYNVGLLLYYQATEEGLLSRATLATVAIVLAFFTTPIALVIFAVLALDVAISRVRGRSSGMRPSFWIVAAIGLVLCAAAIVQAYLSRAGGVAGFAGSPQPISVMTMGLVYMVGVPITVIAAFGFWCMLAEDERLATLLALSALVPLVVFVGFNLWGVDTHVRYMFVSLFAWLALAAAGLEVLIESLQPRWGRLAGWMPVMAFLGTFALADYIYMTGGAGYRGPWRQAMTFVAEHRQPGELVGGDFVAHLMAQYYLEDPEVLLLPARDTFVDDGSLIEDPTWLMYRVYQPSTGDRVGALEVTGELRAYFNSHISEPYQAINVYYYRPVRTPGD